MTHEAEGMDVSQLVASSSATVHGEVHGVFVGAVSPVKSSSTAPQKCFSILQAIHSYLISARGSTQGALIDQRPYMATLENFVTLFP